MTTEALVEYVVIMSLIIAAIWIWDKVNGNA